MTGEHQCGNPECGRPARAGMFACRDCWYALPGARRRAIWRAWRIVLRGDAGALDIYERARNEAVAWFQDNPEAAAL